jgi:hypothetical protein
MNTYAAKVEQGSLSTSTSCHIVTVGRVAIDDVRGLENKVRVE